MFEMKAESLDTAAQAEVAALFARALARDAAFTAAFSSREAQARHAAAFVAHYASAGEIHTFFEDGAYRAAALWSLPGQLPPSPVWETPVAEPCCKLYLIASESPGCGDALMRFALFRYEGAPLALICAAEWQKRYFARYGFRASESTPFGTLLLHDGARKRHCQEG